MQKMDGIVMIQNLHFLFIMKYRKWSGLIYFEPCFWFVMLRMANYIYMIW